MSRSLELADLPGIARLLSEGSRSVWDVLGVKGGAELAAAFSSPLWPEFVEVEDCVLLRERYSPSAFQDWWKELDGDRSGIERVVNWPRLARLRALDWATSEPVHRPT